MRYSDLLIDLRYELSDSDYTEWTDVALMSFIARACHRIIDIVTVNKLNFALRHHPILLVDGIDTYVPPEEFGIKDSLVDVNTAKQIPYADSNGFMLASKWQPLYGAWRVDGGNILIIPPKNSSEVILSYFPKYKRPDSPSSEITFGGEIGDDVLSYAALIAKNVDEMNPQTDMQMLQEIEKNLVNKYHRNEPQTFNGSPAGVYNA